MTAAASHPVTLSQLSFVQAFPSLQLFAPPPPHPPPWQWSLTVQAFPSLHPLELFVNTHPALGLQESLVHAFPSLHGRNARPMQAPPAQPSVVVHTLPSSQLPVLFA